MSKLRIKLKSKLFLSHFIAIFLLAGGFGLYFYLHAFSDLVEMVHSRLLNEAALVSQVISIAEIKELRKPEDTQLPAYTRTLALLRRLKASNPDIAFMYLMRREGQKGQEKVTFVIDSDETKDQAMPGKEYTELTPELIEGFDRASAERITSKDDYGDFISGFAPIPGGEGNYLVGLDMKAEDFRAKLRGMQFAGLVALLCTICFALILSHLLSGRFYETIGTLIDQCRAVAQGRLNEPITLKTGDEWEDLISAFNQMSHELEQSDRLQQQTEESLRESKADLEQKVRERTADLENSNKLLCGEIDERRRTESFLRIAQDLSQDGVLVINDSGVSLSHNRRWLDLWGVTEEEIFAKDFSGVQIYYGEKIEAADRSRVIEQIKSDAQKRLTSTIEYSLGSGGILELYSTPILGQDRKYFGRAYFLRDIAERRKVEQSLREISASKDRLFSIIAHDLNNPFLGIMGTAEILTSQLDQLTKEEIRQYLQGLNTSAESAYKLLKQLLMWARFQLGHLDYYPGPLELWGMAEANVQFVSSLAEQKKIGLVNEVSKEGIAFGDMNMINTIVRNLLTNAIKFTPPGGKIVLSSAENGDWVELSVKDNGVGMSLETRNKLFNLGKSNTTLGTAEERGSGLGLILVNEMVQRHGGKLKIVSELNQGSCFTFSIPKSL